MTQYRAHREAWAPAVLATGSMGSEITLVDRTLKTPAFSRFAIVVNQHGHSLIDWPGS